MPPIGSAGIALLIANGIISWLGFSKAGTMEKYCFRVGPVLEQKDYKRLITSGFLHVSWPHLIINMFTLIVFSRLLEYTTGSMIYLAIYFTSLVGGNLFALYIHRHHSDYSAVGASGAIAGIVFSSIALFPGLRLSLFFVPIFIPSWLFGLLYVMYSIYGIHSRAGNIGHEAHLGGAIAGMVLTILLYPHVLETNYIPIISILIPTILFIYVIIRHPHLLVTGNLRFTKKQYHNIDERYNAEKKNRENNVDRILEKIHNKGINSLDEKEKAALDEYSNRGQQR